MRTDHAVNPDPEDSLRGPWLELEREQSAETEGNTQFVLDAMVQHGSEPFPGRFGLLSSKIYNERNTNKSRVQNTEVDIDDLHTLESGRYDGMSEIGADDVAIESELVDLSTFTPESGHKILSDSVQALDRYHGKRTKEEVTDWKPRVDTIKGDGRAGGEDTIVTSKVVPSTEPWPSTDDPNLLSLRQEQIGVDKFQRVQERANVRGTLRSQDSFAGPGCPATTEIKRVPLGFALPPSDNARILEQRLVHEDGFGKTFIRTMLDDPYPILVSYEEEPTTGLQVEIQRQVLAADPGFNTDGSPRRVVDVRHTGCDRWAKTVRTIHADILSRTFTEFHAVQYDFPAYLDETTPFLILDSGDSSVVNPLRSADLSLKIPCRFETTYHSTPPNALEVFQFKTIDVVLSGVDFNIAERNVITDGATVQMRIKTGASGFVSLQEYLDNPDIFRSVVQFEFGASSPTTTEYKDLMTNNTEVLIADDSSRWKYNLWKRTKVYMRMPDLTADLSGSLIY